MNIVVYGTLRRKIRAVTHVPQKNLAVAASVWWFCSWKTCFTLMIFMIFAIPFSPLLLWPFGMDAGQRLHALQGIAALLVFPVHVYFLAKSFQVQHAGCNIVIQKHENNPGSIDNDASR